MVTYDESYHKDKNYTVGDPKEIEIKQVQAAIIKHIADPTKCVVAGCSNGELVRQCRRQGINAHGFDVIPNLREIAFEEVRDYLRVGSLTEIPYEVEDGFDTLIAVDVLEHIAERDVGALVEQWNRLGLEKLVLLINLNQFWFPGHITMRPISWWGEQWKDHFRLSQTVRGWNTCLPSTVTAVSITSSGLSGNERVRKRDCSDRGFDLGMRLLGTRIPAGTLVSFPRKPAVEVHTQRVRSPCHPLLSLVRVEITLAEPEALRSDLDEFVVTDELDGLFQ